MRGGFLQIPIVVLIAIVLVAGAGAGTALVLQSHQATIPSLSTSKQAASLASFPVITTSETNTTTTDSDQTTTTTVEKEKEESKINIQRNQAITTTQFLVSSTTPVLPPQSTLTTTTQEIPVPLLIQSDPPVVVQIPPPVVLSPEPAIPLQIISAVTIPQITSVRIEWETNKPTQAKVFLSQSGSLLKVVSSNSGASTRHFVDISNLSGDAEYQYEIEVINDGVVAKKDGSFKTLMPPPPSPTLTLFWGNSDISNDYMIYTFVNEQVPISWKSENADNCSLSERWYRTGEKISSKSTSGSENFMSSFPDQLILTFTCGNSANSPVSRTVRILVKELLSFSRVESGYDEIAVGLGWVKGKRFWQDANLSALKIVNNYREPVFINRIKVKFSGSALRDVSSFLVRVTGTTGGSLPYEIYAAPCIVHDNACFFDFVNDPISNPANYLREISSTEFRIIGFRIDSSGFFDDPEARDSLTVEILTPDSFIYSFPSKNNLEINSKEVPFIFSANENGSAFLYE